MKYINQINIVIVLTAVVVVGISFSRTYWTTESSYPDLNPTLNRTPVAPTERAEPDTSRGLSEASPSGPSGRVPRTPPLPQRQQQVPAVTGAEESGESDIALAEDEADEVPAGEEDAESSGGRQNRLVIQRPSSSRPATPDLPAQTSGRTGARSSVEPGAEESPPQRPPTASGSQRRESPPPPPTRSSMPGNLP